MLSEKSAFIRHISFNDIRAFLPEVLPWDAVTLPPDVFITALGFEDRSLAIAEELAGRLSVASTCFALLGCYQSNLQDNEANGDRMRAALGAFCIERREFCADSPSDIDRMIRRTICHLKAGRDSLRVVFDISGASGTFIVSVLFTLISLASHITLEILYAEPQDYFPSRRDFDLKVDSLIEEGLSEGDENSFAERGVSDVDINELYPGHKFENRPDRVIAIPSLRTSRLIRCLAHVGDQIIGAPRDSILWILGEPPASGLKWRAELQRMIVNRQLLHMAGKDQMEAATGLDDASIRSASTLDYRDVLEILISGIDQFSGDNLWIVHMGSKMQAVGVSLALHVRDELTVLRSRPIQFNAAKYSRGTGTIWRVRFEEFEKTLVHLRRVGQIELQAKLETSRDQRPRI